MAQVVETIPRGIQADVYPNSQHQASQGATTLKAKVLTYISWDPFYSHGLTLIPAWISNHMPCKARDEITDPFLTSTVAPLKFRNG